MSTGVVFGGTGMLAEALKWMASQNDHVISFSRGRKNVAGLDNVTNHVVDFGHLDALAQVQHSLIKDQNVQHALIWVHPEHHTFTVGVLDTLKEVCSGTVVHVFGTYDPASEFTPEQFAASYSEDIKYRWVKLGRIGSRWLTDEEISEGAIAALRDGQNKIVGHVVGHVAR